LFKKNFPEKYAQYQAEKIKNNKIVKNIDPLAKKALK
jgi:Cu/Ag efflux protein CusF